MRSSIEDFVKSTSGVSNQVIQQFSAELYKKAYERVVKEIVDKRDRIAKQLSKRQPEQLLEQYVSSCVKKIVTTASPVQEEVKAQDVVSALRNAPKDNIPNWQVKKNVATPGAAQGKGKGVQQTKKGKGERQRQAQKQIERQRTRHSREQKPDEEFWQGKEEHTQGSRLWKRKGGKMEARLEENRKGQKPSMTR